MRQKAICSWCGAPSGRDGVTLRKVALADKAGKLEDTLLCPMCWNEFRGFGRLGSFREWFRAYRKHIGKELGKTLRQLGSLLSPRRHWNLILRNYRFRTKAEKFRA